MLDSKLGVIINEERRALEANSEIPQVVLVGKSEPIRQMRSWMCKLSHGDLFDPPVLLYGETGTGKSLIARMIHQQGRRRNGPFVEANCTAIPASVFEGEMFGVARGAYHHQIHNPGYFEKAARGTLLLDEIGDLPLSLQPKLLTALSSRRYYRVGDLAERPLDLHLLCATQHDLTEEVRSGRFRQDLLFRIRCNVCRVPPLRERGQEDIAALLQHFAGQLLKLPIETLPCVDDHFTYKALEYLYGYAWPGNVREVENLFHNVALCQKLWTNGKEKVELRDIEEALGGGSPPGTPCVGSSERATTGSLPPPGLTLAQLNHYLRDVKSAYVERIVREHNGNKQRAAKALGTSRSALYELLGHRES